MGRMMASGEAVPITSLEGVTAIQAEALEAKGITDVEKLAATSVDDLVDTLDVSLDQAEKILASANAIVAAKEEETAPAEEPVSEGDDETALEAAGGSSEASVEEPEDAGDAAAAVEADDPNEDVVHAPISETSDTPDLESTEQNASEASDEAHSQEPETPAE